MHANLGSQQPASPSCAAEGWTGEPCSADAALRRAIPAVNEEVRRVQGALEDVAFKLRIPQRKPWPAMADDVAAAARVVAQRDKARP